MLLFFVLFIFFIFHIQFLVRNLFFGVDESQFFDFTLTYQFDHHIALQSLLFTLACAGCFALFYKLAYHASANHTTIKEGLVDLRGYRRELLLLNIMGMSMVTYILVLGGLTGFSYGPMTLLRESSNFVFELRMVFLILLSHVLFNVPWKQFLSRPELKSARWVSVLYFTALLLFQARSAVFELAVVVIFPLLMWAGDKVKLKYILVMLSLLIIPNLIVLGRLGIPDNPYDLVKGLFSIEYTTMLDNFLGAAISGGYTPPNGFSFLPQLGLLIPSPLRSLFDMTVVQTDFFDSLSDSAGVFGGGFSLLAQSYVDFGWFSPLIFGLLGGLIGRMNNRTARVGHAKLVYAAAPLLYAAFLLAFRNDIGVFLKYTLQLFLVSFLLGMILKQRSRQKLDMVSSLVMRAQADKPIDV